MPYVAPEHNTPIPIVTLDLAAYYKQYNILILQAYHKMCKGEELTPEENANLFNVIRAEIAREVGRENRASQRKQKKVEDTLGPRLPTLNDASLNSLLRDQPPPSPSDSEPLTVDAALKQLQEREERESYSPSIPISSDTKED